MFQEPSATTSPSRDTSPAPHFGCNWDWCRVVLPSYGALIEHVIDCHIRVAKPITPNELALVLKAEEGVTGIEGLIMLINPLHRILMYLCIAITGSTLSIPVPPSSAVRHTDEVSRNRLDSISNSDSYSSETKLSHRPSFESQNQRSSPAVSTPSSPLNLPEPEDLVHPRGATLKPIAEPLPHLSNQEQLSQSRSVLVRAMSLF
jgi:hypothetical protein